jgi:uncharacterized SAM-binding protein YcdF (DUF218 family)
MKDMMISLGVSPDRIVLDSQSANTYETALQVGSYCGEMPFFLVTSARHMPRAMGVLIKQGLNPVPAPTDYRSIKHYQLIAVFPSPLHLELADMAVYEYLGLLWYEIKDRI